MLFNVLIQAHFDHASSSYLGNRNLTEKQKMKIQVMKTKYVRFYLRLNKTLHISLTEFRSKNCLHIKETVHHWVNAVTLKFLNSNCPFYLNGIFEFSPYSRIITRNSFERLKHYFARLPRDRKPYLTLVPLCGNINLDPVKSCYNQLFSSNQL